MRKNNFEDSKMTVNYIKVYSTRTQEEADFVADWIKKFGYEVKISDDNVLVECADDNEELTGIIDMALNSVVEKISYTEFMERIVIDESLDMMKFDSNLAYNIFFDNRTRIAYLGRIYKNVLTINYKINWNVEDKCCYTVDDIIDFFSCCERNGKMLQVNRVTFNLKNVVWGVCGNRVLVFYKYTHKFICSFEDNVVEYLAEVDVK